MRLKWIGACALLAVAVAACDRNIPRPVLSRECAAVGGAASMHLTIVPPSSGTLRVLVEPRGVAVAVRSGTDEPSGFAATSPVDRLGPIALVERVVRGQAVRLEVRSRDWPSIRGEVCVRADLLHRADLVRNRAERAFARAGLATQQRQWQQAFDGYALASRDFSRLHLQRLAGAARHAMGELAYMRLRREVDALRLAGQALATYGREADGAVRGALLALEARAAADSLDLDEPAHLERVARTIERARRALADSHGGGREALRLIMLEGYVAYRTGSPERAQQLFRRAMKRCASSGDWECHGGAAQNLALLAEESHSYEVALAAYEASLRHLGTEVAPELTADIWDNLGRLERVVGLVQRSERSHGMALRLYGRVRNCDGARRALARLGALHGQTGSVDDATLELGDAASLACKTLLAKVTRRAVDAAAVAVPEHACRALIEPAELSSDGKIAVLQAVLALGQTLLLAGDLPAAERCITQAGRYATTARGRLRSANAAGELLLAQEKSAAALQAYRAAEELAREAGIPQGNEHRSRTSLGLAQATLLEGSWQEAQPLVVHALRESSLRTDLAQTVDGLRTLAWGTRRAGKPELAAQTLHLAVELIEQVPIDELDGEVRALYLAAQHAVFSELVSLLASAARTDADVWRALFAAERGRARSLKYASSEDRPEDARQNTNRHSYRELLQRIAASAAGDSPERTLAAVTELAPSTGSNEASLDGQRRALQASLRSLDATLVQYAAGQKEMFAFVVDAQRIAIVPLGDRETVARASVRLVDTVRDREALSGAVRDAASRLAARAWWPLAPLIRTKRVLLAPEDALHLVPFAALPWSAAPADGLVLDRIETSIVPSGTFVTGQPVSEAARLNLTLLGDPVFRSAQWRQLCARQLARQRSGEVANAAVPWTEWLPSLPASRTEVLGIAKLAQVARDASHLVTLLGCEATAARLRAAASQPGGVVHIATHGRIDARRPRLSALALTPDASSPDDASFTLLDILSLDLQASLVTLSSCDTSRGRLLSGEGVLGLAQAFLQAGAASVVATYWLVEDETTASFMQAFYRRLLQDGMSASEALRATQLEAKKSAHPFSWAAYGLHGRPDTRI